LYNLLISSVQDLRKNGFLTIKALVCSIKECKSF
jgi:hypothetical protein